MHNGFGVQMRETAADADGDGRKEGRRQRRLRRATAVERVVKGAIGAVIEHKREGLRHDTEQRGDVRMRTQTQQTRHLRGELTMRLSVATVGNL